jgi:hypothetical protein
MSQSKLHHNFKFLLYVLTDILTCYLPCFLEKMQDAKFVVNNRRLLKVELTLPSYSFHKRTSGATYAGVPTVDFWLECSKVD